MRLLAIISLSLLAATGLVQEADLTLEDIFKSDRFDEKGLEQFRWLPSGDKFSYLDTDLRTKHRELVVYDCATNKKTSLVDLTSLVPKGQKEPLQIHGYQWSPDAKMLLVSATPPTRYFVSSQYYVYELGTRRLWKLTKTTTPQMHAKFSPNSRLIGYVQNDNIYVRDLSKGETRQLTSDAKQSVYNGRFGWVYEEELGMADGFCFSPDSKSIAYFQVDERQVPRYSITDFMEPHLKMITRAYPKAGDRNPEVRIGIISVRGTRTRWCEPKADNAGYLAYLQWTPRGDRLLVQRMPRLQNQVELLAIDPKTGKASTLIREKDVAWLDANGPLRFVKRGDKNYFTWASERTGWRNLYLYTLQGRLAEALTEESRQIDAVCPTNDPDATLLVTAGENPWTRILTHAKRNGQPQEPVVMLGGAGEGWLSFDSSPSGNWAIVHQHSASAPPRVWLVNCAEPSRSALLLENKLAGMQNRKLAVWEFGFFTTSDGEKLPYKMLKPRNFNPAKRYPVLMYTYGGPGSQVVTDSWMGKQGLWYQMLAQKGYVIFMVDNRGTGARGSKFMKQTYKNLGHWELNDQLEAANYLGRQPFVDAQRIGIWGWSYGGYVSALCAVKGKGAFKIAMAGAPVTDWRLYDTIYTERYMQTPQQNRKGYDNSSVILHAGEMERTSLLLIHGTADDNVHLQNTVQLIEALVKAEKQYTLVIYPGHAHGVTANYHRFSLMTEFILRNL